jgi:hypothetical protein
MKKKSVDSLEEHVEVSGSSRSLAEGRHKQPRKSHLGRKHNTASAWQPAILHKRFSPFSASILHHSSSPSHIRLLYAIHSTSKSNLPPTVFISNPSLLRHSRTST